MSRAHELFRPNGLKLLLAATLVIPVFFIGAIVTGFPYDDLFFPAVVSVIAAYAAACVTDDLVKSRTIKILIASVAAVVSILIGYIVVRSMTMVCDPVHDPGGMVCDPVHIPETTTVPETAAMTTNALPLPTTATTTASPATTMVTTNVTTPPVVMTPAVTLDPRTIICDPVHVPDSCGPEYGVMLGTTTGIVAEKLDECLKNL